MAVKLMNTSARSNGCPASAASEVGFGSAGSKRVWFTFRPMPITDRER
ncbi:MAG: hypothetical protein ACLR8Y_07135 [Alistipes indistinctus]